MTEGTLEKTGEWCALAGGHTHLLDTKHWQPRHMIVGSNVSIKRTQSSFRRSAPPEDSQARLAILAVSVSLGDFDGEIRHFLHAPFCVLVVISLSCRCAGRP